MKISIKTGSENYTAQVIKLPAKVEVKGFDRLVQVTHQGNDCLVSKDSPEDQLYLFFPAGSALAPEYLQTNNLYRHQELNRDKTEKGLIDDNGRVKSVKMKGVISTGLIMPLSSLQPLVDPSSLKIGDSFNTINGHDLCTKYILPQKAGNLNAGQKQTKILDNIVDKRQFPDHFSTPHVLRNLHLFDLDTNIVITVKAHGSSFHTSKTLIKKELSWKDKLAKKLGVNIITHEYAQLVGSRRVLKSVNFKALNNKNHYYGSEDLWSKAVKENLEGKLNAGEAIYGEILGKTYSGAPIQKGYDYGFDKPMLQIYRITNINPEGIEVDLSWDQLVIRCSQLGVPPVIPIFQGKLREFIYNNVALDGPYWNGDDDLGRALEEIFYGKFLDKPSIIGGNPRPVEEGYCIRIESFPQVKILKIKSKKFILQESKLQDESVEDIEESN